jgi:GAF domain-containing protein
MEKNLLNYETLLKITERLSMSRDFDEVTLLAVTGIRDALDTKGCALFLINPKTQELEIAASVGLSDEYLNKGPISARKSIADSLKDGPVAIYDVTDDPRIQYPEEASREGIASILAVPIMARGNPIGAVRIYTADKWEFNIADVNLVQAVAQIAGMAIEMSRLYKGLKSSIEILKSRQDHRALGAKRWTPHEGVPVSEGRMSSVTSESS